MINFNPPTPKYELTLTFEAWGLPNRPAGSNLVPAMLRRFASALLVLLLLGAAVAGAATRLAARECPMPGMHDCCKRAHSGARAVAPAMTCCLADRPQPAPARTNFTLRAPSDASPAPTNVAARTPALAVPAHPRAYAPPFQPSHSPPAYIQHLALLI